MTIARAFIVDAPNEGAANRVLGTLTRGDVFHMYAFHKEENGSRVAVAFFDEHKDKRDLNFSKVADLVTKQGNTELPSSQFRDLNTFKPWPANFAVIKVG